MHRNPYKMDKTIAISVLLFFILYSSQSELYTSSSECPKSCMCIIYGNGTIFVNCSGLQLTEIPSDIPHKTLYLDLSENHITTIQPYAFRNLTYLRSLTLENNKLSQGSITNASFSGLPMLDQLDLSSNNFHAFPRYLPVKMNSFILLSLLYDYFTFS